MEESLDIVLMTIEKQVARLINMRKMLEPSDSYQKKINAALTTLYDIKFRLLQYA